MSEIIKLKPSETLMNEGAESTEMYYLQSGSLAVFKQKGEKQIQIGTITEGELVGEMSFLDNHPRSATVNAITECVLVVVPREKYEEVLNANPKWMKSLLITLIERIRKAKTMIKI